MAKRRCAFEGSRFESTDFEEEDGFLIHKDADDHSKYLDPVHEAIQGRLLRRGEDNKWKVDDIELPPAAPVPPPP